MYLNKGGLQQLPGNENAANASEMLSVTMLTLPSSNSTSPTSPGLKLDLTFAGRYTSASEMRRSRGTATQASSENQKTHPKHSHADAPSLIHTHEPCDANQTTHSTQTETTRRKLHDARVRNSKYERTTQHEPLRKWWPWLDTRSAYIRGIRVNLTATADDRAIAMANEHGYNIKEQKAAKESTAALKGQPQTAANNTKGQPACVPRIRAATARHSGGEAETGP